jgi:hypothetical protein
MLFPGLEVDRAAHYAVPWSADFDISMIVRYVEPKFNILNITPAHWTAQD